MTTPLYLRQVIVDVNLTRITGLRCAFKVEKSHKAKIANSLDLTIYNLSEDSRRAIQESGAYVKLQAGYENALEMIFSGDAVTVTSARQGPDWITKLQSADGSKRLRTARVNESFAPGTSIVDVAKRLARTTLLGLGNADDELSAGSVRGSIVNFAKGFVASGNASEKFDDVVRTMGYEWSVQDGAIQVSRPGLTIGSEVVVLSPATGLIGSPEAGEKGIVKARGLIQQRMLPARKVKLESESFTGFYRIEKVTFTGDTHGTEWYAELELKPL